MRFVGLIDPSSSLYSSWRVPQALAPYPQDYIIDRQGIVRYWSDQFDPQEVIATIDRLLATGVAEPAPACPWPRLAVRPAPVGRRFTISAPGLDGPARVEVTDALGRIVERLALGPGPLDWRPDLPAGSYFLRRPGSGSAALIVIVR